MTNIDELILIHVSFLSTIAGEISLSMKSIRGKGKMFCWTQKSAAHYWLTYDNGLVTILEKYAPSKEMYAVIGYCSYHEIDLQIDDRVHDDDTPPANVVPI
jgi:hypothetical protein